MKNFSCSYEIIIHGWCKIIGVFMNLNSMLFFFFVRSNKHITEISYAVQFEQHFLIQLCFFFSINLSNEFCQLKSYDFVSILISNSLFSMVEHL